MFLPIEFVVLTSPLLDLGGRNRWVGLAALSLSEIASLGFLVVGYLELLLFFRELVDLELLL